MPSRRAVIVSSCDPCASATSKSRPFAHARSAWSREVSWRAFPTRERPPWWPITVAVHPVLLDQLEGLCVLARRDLDLVAARLEQLDERPEDERVRTRRHVDPDPHRGDHLLERRVARDPLDVPLEPEREREQAPQLPGQVLAARRRGGRAPRSTASGCRYPCRRTVAAESVSRANGSSSPRSHAAAGIEKPRLRPWTTSPRQQRLHGAAQQPLLREAAHLLRRGEREREARDDRVQERHPRLERPRHRGAVGLHQQIVGEIPAECPRPAAAPGARAPPSRRTGRGRATPGPSRAGARSARRARPGRRSSSTRGAARAAAGAPPARSAWRGSRSSPAASRTGAVRRPDGRGPPRRRPARRAGRRRRCSSRRRARRRPRPRARPSRPLPRGARRGRSAAPRSRRTARRTRRRAQGGAAPRRGAARARGGASRSAPRPPARRRARRTTAPRSRSRTSAPAPSPPARRARRGRRSRRRPRAAPRRGRPPRGARAPSRASRARHSSTSSASSASRTGSGPGPRVPLQRRRRRPSR